MENEKADEKGLASRVEELEKGLCELSELQERLIALENHECVGQEFVRCEACDQLLPVSAKYQEACITYAELARAGAHAEEKE